MIPIHTLIYVVIRLNSEVPYVRPTATTPATITKTPASIGPCLVFARLVTLRAGTHTPAGRQRPHGRSRFSFDVSDGRICDPTAAAGLRDPVHRGARDDGPGALDHGDHATDIRPRVCAGQILRGAVRQQIFWGTSYDWSILGLGYSRFMIQESGSCLVSARGWQFTHSSTRQQFTPPRVRDDGDGGSGYTPPSPAPSASSPLLQILSSSGILCVVGWKRGWCYTEGESGAMRPGAYL